MRTSVALGVGLFTLYTMVGPVAAQVEPVPSAEAPTEEPPQEREEIEVAPAPAPAVDPAAEPEAPEYGDEEEIIVTGTHIQRSTFSSASPVEVIDRDELERSGFTDMKDLARNLTVGGGNTGGGGNASFEASGVQMINLRNLGGNATLILLNGRRLPRSGAGLDTSFTDLSTIPLGMIERVEILRGGASAIYGSDAIAGVVNIITRRRPEGVRTEVQVTTTDDLDHQLYETSVSGGVSGDFFGIGAGATYLKSTSLPALDREFTEGQYSRTIGDPGFYAVVVREDAQETPFELIPDPRCPDPDGWLAVDQQDEITRLQNELGQLTEGTDEYERVARSIRQRMRGEQFAVSLRDNANVTYSAEPIEPSARHGRVVPDPDERGFFCQEDTRRNRWLRPDRDQVSGFLHGSLDLSDHLQLNVEGFYAHSSTDNRTDPVIGIFRDVQIPGSHFDAPWNMHLYARPFNSVLPASAPGATTTYTTDTFRVTGSLDGDFADAFEDTVAEDWGWEIGAAYGEDKYNVVFTDVLLPAYAEAVSDASCPPMATPEERQQMGCFNPYDPTANSPEVLDNIIGHPDQTVTTSLLTADLVVDGSLLELPGGDLAFAVGYQFRREGRNGEFDQNTNDGNFNFIDARSDFDASRDIHSAYTELVLPVLMGAELQPAVRFEEYEDAGSALSPKVGLVLSVGDFFDEPPEAIAGLRLRGVVASSFRAPNLAQTDEDNVVLGVGNVTVPHSTHQPESERTSSVVSTPNFGNAQLEPEIALAYSAGLEWAWEGMLALFDYWVYDYQDRVVRQDEQAVFDENARQFRCLVDPDDPLRDADGNLQLDDMGNPQPGPEVPEPLPGDNCDEFGVPPGSLTRVEFRDMFSEVERSFVTDSPAIIRTQYLNASEVFTMGMDFGLTYSFGAADFGSDADIGTFSLGGTATYVLTFKYREQPEDPSVDCSAADEDELQTPAYFSCEKEAAGKRNTRTDAATTLPRLRFRAPVSWDYAGHGLAFITRYVGPYEDDGQDFNPDDPPDATVPAFVTFDLQYRYNFRELIDVGLEARVGVINMFDTDPPRVRSSTTGGHDRSVHDNRGRLVYTRLALEL